MVEINSRCPFKGGVRLKGSPIKESDWRKNGANLGFSLRDQNECLISVEESIKTELSVLLESYYWPLSRNSCTIRRGKFKQFSLLMITSWLIFLVVNVFISLIGESRDKDNCQKAHRLHWNNPFFDSSCMIMWSLEIHPLIFLTNGIHYPIHSLIRWLMEEITQKFIFLLSKLLGNKQYHRRGFIWITVTP